MTVLLPDPRSTVVSVIGMMLIDESPVDVGKGVGVIPISPALEGSEVGVGPETDDDGLAVGNLGVLDVRVSAVTMALEEGACGGAETLGVGDSGEVGRILVGRDDRGWGTLLP